MTPLVAFKAQNHRQQLAVRGPRDIIDDRGTDPALYEKLDRRFHFTLDAAAAPHNAKHERYFTRLSDGLVQSWEGERVWCNPPYSDIRPWVEKATASGAELVVMLLPANRTEQGWWQEWIEPHRDRIFTIPGHHLKTGRYWTPSLRVEFLPGRPRFVRYAEGRSTIEPNERPPFGCCLAIWTDDRGIQEKSFRDIDAFRRTKGLEPLHPELEEIT